MVDMYNEFHSACMGNNLTLVQVFITDGVDINSQDNPAKETALFIATKHCLYDMVKYLLSMKAKRCLPNSQGLLPLHIALINSDMPMVQLLCDFKTINCSIIDDLSIASRGDFPAGSTAVHIAAKMNNIQLMTQICRYNPNFFQKDCHGHTPLDLVIDQHQNNHGSCDLLATILETTAVFHTAISKGYKNVVKQLIQCGADVNSCDKHRGTALYVAVDAKKLDLVRELVDHGCDLNTQIYHTSFVRRYQQGLTALHLACFQIQVDAVEILTKAGASTNTKDAFQDTPLSTMCKMNWRIMGQSHVRENIKVIVEHLLHHHACVNIAVGPAPLLQIAMGFNLRSMVNNLIIMLLSAGAPIHVLNEKLEQHTDEKDLQEHLMSLPQTTLMFLYKCGMNRKHLNSSSSAVSLLVLRPLSLLDTCTINIRRLLQSNCLNIWSAIELLNLPPGFNADVLKYNWKRCLT